VTHIVRELRERMATRGQVGQIRKQEAIMGMIGDVEDDMKLLMKNKDCAYPPAQAYMQSRFPQNPPDLTKARPVPETVEVKTYDVTNKIDSCLTCCLTCGIAGCTTETMELKEDDMFIKTVNNLDDSDVKIPYAEMDSVDVMKSGCCCFSVNEQSPGLGCEKEKVDLIASDLQECKYKRGNIAHLKQLRAMQTTALGVDVMADLLLQKEGIQFPPAAEAMSEVFPGAKPWALTHELKSHIEPDQEFETKTYSVTNIPAAIMSFVCCPCTGCHTTELELGPDEMLLINKDWCNQTQSRTPYGNIGSVETETTCCVCTELPEIAMPGCGCSEDLVNEIAGELQARKEKRGNIAQMRQQENIIVDILNTEAKIAVLAHHYKVQYPPAPEVMAQVFKAAP
jgi:hypothetical protein